MQTKLIIINWLFSWIPLSYKGESLLIAAIVICYFAFASLLLTTHKKAVDKEMKRFNNWIDRIITSNK